MSFVGIEINNSEITKICNNTIVLSNKDSVGIKLTNSDSTVVSEKDNKIIANKTIVKIVK